MFCATYEINLKDFWGFYLTSFQNVPFHLLEDIDPKYKISKKNRTDLHDCSARVFSHMVKLVDHRRLNISKDILKNIEYCS